MNFDTFLKNAVKPEYLFISIGLALLGLLILRIATSSKFKFWGFQLPASYSKAARTNRKISVFAGWLMIFAAIFCLITAFIPTATDNINSERPRGAKVKGILSLHKNCIGKACHQDKNFAIIVDDFSSQVAAENYLDYLQGMNATNPKYFPYSCETNQRFDKHLVFINRRFSTYKSALKTLKTYQANEDIEGDFRVVEFL